MKFPVLAYIVLMLTILLGFHAYATGLSASASGITSVSPNQEYQMLNFSPGLLATIVNGKGSFHKIVKASTLDNLEVSAVTLTTCSPNPTVTMYNCGASASCGSPVAMSSSTLTVGSTVVDGTNTNTVIAAGDYVAFAISAGTCVALDVQATAQIHTN